MHHRFDEGALLRILDMRHHMEYSIDADGNSANFLVIAALYCCIYVTMSRLRRDKYNLTKKKKPLLIGISIYSRTKILDRGYCATKYQNIKFKL